MFMQMTISMIIILALSLPAVATECKSELIGLIVFFYSKGDEWSITWARNEVHKKKADYYANLKEDYRTNKYDSRGNKRAETMPQALLSPDKQFNVPFVVSQDKEFLIAAIHKKSGVMSPSKQLAIVDLKKQKIVRIIETEYDIRSLVWAPDDKYFAVLYEQDVTKQVFKGPLDWFAEYLGHGNYYWTFYLTLYQPDGTPVCTEQVEKKLPNAMSYIDWETQ